ncbi:MAG: NUDIX domain-containing protein [Candidatus Berkelbacteria bacterium]
MNIEAAERALQLIRSIFPNYQRPHMGTSISPEARARQLAQLDEIRLEGYRPCVIAALACQGRVGLFHTNRYPGYEFAQGGIELGEIPAETIEREIREEAGDGFSMDCAWPIEPTFMFEARMETKVKGVLKTSNGTIVSPRGKHYLVYAVPLQNTDYFPEIQFEWEGESMWKENGGTIQFTGYSWADARASAKLTRRIQSPRKQEIVQSAISSLVSLGFVH